MDFKNLHTFIQVAELGSFTKAANKLGYSQSTVSFQIKQLEEELHVHLFERINHTIMLTPMGKQMLQYALQITNLSNEMKHATSKVQEVKGEVRIATAQSLTYQLLGNEYVSFHEKYPGITLKIMAAGTEQMFRMLNHNEVDLVLTLDSHIYQSEYVIAKEKLVSTHFVTGKNYNLQHTGASSENIDSVVHKNNSDSFSTAVNSNSVSLAEISKEPFLLTEKGMSYRRLLDELLAAKSLEISPILEVDNTRFICQLLSKNIGISFLPDYTTASGIESGDLKYIPVDDCHIEIWQQLLYHRDKWISPTVQTVIDYIINNSFHDINH